jgi:hypothetical protein
LTHRAIWRQLRGSPVGVSTSADAVRCAIGCPVMKLPEAVQSIAELAWHATDCDCWIWPHRTSPDGRPVLSVEGETTLVHRLGYGVWRRLGHRLAGPLRPSVPLLRSCKNPLCVNPFHLSPVDSKDVGDPRGAWNRVKLHCPRGHPLSGDNLHRRRSGRRRCRSCHREEQRRRRNERSRSCLSTGGAGS